VATPSPGASCGQAAGAFKRIMISAVGKAMREKRMRGV
jgi:hypothetical protein